MGTRKGEKEMGPAWPSHAVRRDMRFAGHKIMPRVLLILLTILLVAMAACLCNAGSFDGLALDGTLAWLATASVPYDGIPATPAAIVKCRSGNGTCTLRPGSDYTVEYADNTLPGTATATIKGIGRYKGSVYREFTIAVPGAEIRSVTVSAAGLYVQWDGALGFPGGWQVSWSTDAAFKADTVCRCVEAGQGGMDIGGLKPGTVYYVRIRAYAAAGGREYPSGWSEAVEARTAAPTATPTPTATPKPKQAPLRILDGQTLYTDKEKPNVQGLCTDGKFLYAAFRDGGSAAEYDTRNTTLRKLDLKGKLIASNSDFCYCHANGMAYCDADGLLYIATLGRAENVKAGKGGSDRAAVQKYGAIAVVDPKTLQCLRVFNISRKMRKLGLGALLSLENGLWEAMDAPVLSQVNWDPVSGVFRCQVRPYRLHGERKRRQGIVTFDRSWNLLGFVELPYKSYSGNMTTDGRHWFLALNKPGREKAATVLDGSFNVLATLRFQCVSAHELENFAIVGKRLYVTCNTKPASIEVFDIVYSTK